MTSDWLARLMKTDEDDGLKPDWLLLEDGPLIAVCKPVGLLTEGPDYLPTMVREVKDWLRRKYGKSGRVYLGIPHRLDRVTSGVLVFGKNSKVAARLAEQFHDRKVQKVYWTLLDQKPEPEAGELVDWLLKDSGSARSQIVDASTPGAKEARLEYQTLGRVGERWLVEVKPLTGRTHQIRVQFAGHGCPIAGDARYGGKPWQNDVEPQTLSDGFDERQIRIALHARALTLFHPIRYDAMTIEAPLPADWSVPVELLIDRL